MRIALFSDGIQPYVMGGMQKHSFFIAKYLSRAGIGVDLYHFNQSDYDINALDVFTEEERKHIRSIVVPFTRIDNIPGHYLRESYLYSERIFSEWKKNQDVDFIYVKGFAGWKLLAERAKGLKTPPVGIKFHGLEMFQRTSGLRSWLEACMLRGPVKFNLKHSDYVFSYGGKITDLLIKNGVKEKRIVEIATGIEEEKLRQPDLNRNGLRKFIFVGRNERRKGIVELNKALNSLLAAGSSFEFHFAGPIPESQKIRSGKIIYHGSVNDPRAVLDLIHSCDVLVCPSYSEGMPNVIIEAMSQGLAVIATNVGAVGNLVNIKNGWLLSSPDPALIQDTMQEAISMNEADLNMKKKNSFEFAEKELNWEKISEKLIGFLKNSLKS
jgi:glycosyltransferase involved in cell wall biosynthesis